MAETTVLRSSASPHNATPTAASPQAKTSGPHPIVSVVMGSGGKPQIGAQQNSAIKSVTILPKSAMGMRRTAGMPAPLTPQVAARVAELGIAPLADGAAPTPSRTIRKHAAAASSPLTTDQMMLCRHLVDAYLRDLPPGAETEVIAVTTLASLDGLLASAAPASAPEPEGPPPMVEVTAPGAGPAPTTVVVGPRATSSSVAGPRRVERAKPPIDVPGHEVEADKPSDQAAQSHE